MKVKEIMANLEAKHPGENEYLQAVREVLETIEEEYNKHPEFEAAKIDGCSFYGIYHRIIFPLCKPLIATVGILAFRSAWNDYMLPMVFTMTDTRRMPLVVGIMHLKSSGDAASSWNLMLAGTAISLIPMMIIYMIFNRYFILGMTAGAVKG